MLGSRKTKNDGVHKEECFNIKKRDYVKLHFLKLIEMFLSKLNITTPNGELLTATDLLQCGVDSSHRLHYVGFQEMRKKERKNFLDSCTNTYVTCEESPKQSFHCFPEFLKFCGFFVLAIISNY